MNTGVHMSLSILKNWCFWTVLGRTLKSPLDCKEIQPVHPKGNQSWIYIGRTDAEAEAPILPPLDGKSWLVWKDPDAGKDWRQEVKGMTEDEMVGCHHRLNGHEFEQALGNSRGQGSLACYSPWGHKDTTQQELEGKYSLLLCSWPWTRECRVLTTITCHLATTRESLWDGAGVGMAEQWSRVRILCICWSWSQHCFWLWSGLRS